LGASNSYSHLIPGASGHGSWLIVMVLDLPTTLPTGTGHFSISAAPEVKYPLYSQRFTAIDIGMEILAGTGSSNTFEYLPFEWNTVPIPSDLTLFESRPKVLIKPNVPPGGGGVGYGAIEIKVRARAETVDGSLVDISYIRVIADDQSTRLISQSHLSWSRQGDEVYIVNIVAPKNMTFYEGRFEIVLREGPVSLEPTAFVGTPTIESIKYFDLDGNVVAGSAPTLSVIQ